MGKGQNKGGKKHKRNKNRELETNIIRIKEDGQEYAQIIKCKGNCRFDVICSDGKSRSAILCGSMRKRKFVNLNDIILVSLRDFQDNICDIIDNYDDTNARKLKETKHLPESFKLGDDNDFHDDLDNIIEFTTDLPSDNSDNDSNESINSDVINLDEI